MGRVWPNAFADSPLTGSGGSPQSRSGTGGDAQGSFQAVSCHHEIRASVRICDDSSLELLREQSLALQGAMYEDGSQLTQVPVTLQIA